MVTKSVKAVLRSSPISALTFDCYGTLVDWETGSCQALRRIYGYTQEQVSDDWLITHFLATDAELVAQGIFPYTRVLDECARRIGTILTGRSLPDKASDFAQSLPDWPLFDDTCSSLSWLSSRYRLGIVSNVDDDLIWGTVQQLKVRFDLIVTSEQCGCYKPGIEIFERTVKSFGCPPEHVVHVAEGLCEAIPARAVGMRSVWVKRSHRSDDGSGAKPDCTVSTLTEIIAALR